MTSKGTTRERQAADIYEQAGYETYRPPHKSGPYGHAQDVFDLFDVLAIRPNVDLRLAQVKSNGARGIRAWCDRAQTLIAGLSDVTADFVVCHDYEGWRLLKPRDGTYATVYDERAQWDGVMGAGLAAWLADEAAGEERATHEYNPGP